MEAQKFKLNIETEYITLDKLLKILRWASSGGEAHRLIEEGRVKVNSEFEFQKRKKLRKGDVVEFNSQLVEIE